MVELFLHLDHKRLDVAVEVVVAVAECIQTRLTRFGLVEPVLRALPVTGEEILASPALRRQAIALADPELYLPGRVHQGADVLREDTAKPVFRINKMIAGIQVAVVFDDGVAAAGLGKHAGSRLHSAPAGKRRIEFIDEIAPYVVTYPVIEDIAQETSERYGRD